MGCKLFILSLMSFICLGSSTDEIPHLAIQNTHDINSPLEFPHNSNSSTLILTGTSPKLANLPPEKFPSESTEHNSTGPLILLGTEENIAEINHSKHEVKLNLTHENTLQTVNLTTPVSTITPENVKKPEEKSVGEQEDMLHSKYAGGKDVDELFKSDKKASEKDEKKPTTPKKDPKSEVDVSPALDKKGPKLMNDTKGKSGESMLESTSRMMAVSSSVLASNTSPTHQGILEPAKTLASLLLTAVVLFGLGAVGLLLWKRIAVRKFGRDVLINEDDFDEVSDMHTFDRAQIQIT